MIVFPSSPARVQVAGSPSMHERHCSEPWWPRTTQETLGSTATRCPTSTRVTPGPVSTTRARISCPSTAGNDPNGSIAGLDLSVRFPMSEPQMPARTTSSLTQRSPGISGSASSPNRTPLSPPKTAASVNFPNVFPTVARDCDVEGYSLHVQM